MAWLQLRFTVKRAQVEALSTVLEGLGAHAVTMQSAGRDILFDQIDESPTLWESTELTALFDGDVQADAIIGAVAAALAPQPLPPCVAQTLADQDWNRAWMDRFQPMRFGERLWVIPSWHTPPEPKAVNLVLDPGMAFGTGTHATTGLCLRWLDGADVHGKYVIDYGCGSGILAIAAIKLGARHADAIDVDPQCLTVTRENAERNGVAAQIHTNLPDAWTPRIADVLIANILAGPLHALAGTFAHSVRSGGDLVLSGLLAPQAEECLAVYAQDFEMSRPLHEADWAMLHGKRR